MTRSLVILLAAAALAAPAFAQAADPAAPAAEKPKMKKVCRSVNNGNPLFPDVKCRMVPVKDAEPAMAVAAAQPAANTQVAQNMTAPQR